MLVERPMLVWLTRILLALRSGLEARASREAEILALRRQLLVLSRRHPRVRLRNIDRLILVWLYRLFPSLLDANGHRKARDRTPLASTRLSRLLAMEVLAALRSAQNRL
jgi:hypothetical protein